MKSDTACIGFWVDIEYNPNSEKKKTEIQKSQ